MLRIFNISFLFSLGYLLSGCTGQHTAPINVQALETELVSPSTITGTLLACVNKHNSLSKKEFEKLYRTALKQNSLEGDSNFLPVVCLGLSPHASYKQFLNSTDIMKEFIVTHPYDTSDLSGLYSLLIRQNKTKMKWQYRYKKMSSEKRSLEIQINQLKNIEKIITDKEHNSFSPNTK
jgi:hypothetical protein